MVDPAGHAPYVFLSYAREDEAEVRDIRERLEAAGIPTWLDTEKIRYGADWEAKIGQAMRHAFRVLAFMSRAAVAAPGYIHLEFRTTLRIAAELPDDGEWVIPVLLDDCRVPEYSVATMTFSRFHAFRLYSGTDRVEHLIETLQEGWPRTDSPSPHQMVIIHSSWRSKKHDATYAAASNGRPVYRFDVRLGLNAAALDAVDSVTWLLPPAWPNSPIRISDPSQSFGHKDLAWGDLVVRANVHVKDRAEPIHLSGFVRLQENGPPLLPPDYDK